MELTGRTLGHYRVLEEISRGGMGVVYRATDTRLNRDVALKVLPDDLTNDADRRRRFLKEAQAASALEHPHIAVIHEADEVDGLAFIAMELIRGEKLSDLLARQRPSAARTLELGAEVAAGLARAHEKGIVHRDLKPANVMVTDEGHAKIIDFGIAKLIESAAIAGAPTQTGHDTGVGVVLGTMTYMSPEQARGGTVDHRADIFSFGILLHEMLAGQPPFRGKTGIETASAILHEPAPRLPSLGPGVAGEASADIQRIVDKCLAKDPDDRYQGMKDLVVDIRAARRHLDTGSQAAASSRPVAARVPAWAWLAAGAAVVAIATGVVLMRPRSTGAGAAGSAKSGKPSVAVMYFDNTTGDKELDWLRTGITEMVVTDLSQSQEIEVVGTDRLYGILAELNRQDDRVLSPDVISAVAERTGVDRVIVGSYVKSGEAIRINVRLQDAKTGRIESSERVEGANASALFSMIDDLARRIRAKFEGLRGDAKLLTAPGGDAPELDRGLGDVTTSSIEAYRLYAEGINLHARFREQEAAAMFEKAIAIDPSFAMAYIKVAVIEGNLGRLALRDKYAAQALKLADRLTPRERFYIEGFFYSNRRATFARAIDAYKKCADIDPGHQACRHNLGLIYNSLERFREGASQYEELLRRGSTNPIAYLNLSTAYRAMGDPEKALSTAESYVKRNPENAVGHATLGSALIGVGRYDEAIRELSQAVLLGSENPQTDNPRVVAQTMREDWDAVAEIAKTLSASSDEARKATGAVTQYMTSLFHGRSGDSLKWADRVSAAYQRPGPQSAFGHRLAALALLARGQTALAATASARAVEDAKGSPAQHVTMVIHAWALSAAGRHKDAEAVIAELVATVDPLSVARDQRNVAQARGLVALARGEAAAAVMPLQDAQAALPARGGGFGGAPPPHLLIWSSLGRALFESGRAADALPWFEKVAASGFEHARDPIDFVRSFYFLGRIYEQQGDMTKARDAYRRFVGYWKDGDLDRDRIAEAQRKIAS